MRVVRRNFLAIISGSLLSVFGQGVQAATGPTLKATKLGQKIVFQGYTYTTIKLKGKLVWKKGAKIVKGSPSATPTATANPTPSSSTSPSATASALTFVAKSSDVRVGDTKVVEIKPASGPNFSVAVSRTSSELIVLSAICTHEGCIVAAEMGRLGCPCHGSAFNSLTGAVTQGPAKAALRKFDASEDGGSIFIKL